MTARLMMAFAASLLLAGMSYGDGLTVESGKNLVSVTVGGKTYKVIGRGVLANGQTVRFPGLGFDSNGPAVVFALGIGQQGDLDLVVRGADGAVVGSDFKLDNEPVVEWRTGNAGSASTRVDLELRNAGQGPCSYVLLANY